ncbi:MAG TPA: hypothetical protein VKU87_07390 [Thermomicrobiaceae bacterium]|nr:hypothetical protein [Thermomicrobiaceae bacterium]
MAKRYLAFVWDGPERDVLDVLAEPDASESGIVISDAPDVLLFRVLDANDEPTGAIVGVEIIDFLSFDDWDAVPALDVPVSPLDASNVPLRIEVQRLQQKLRAEIVAAATANPR